MRQSSRCERMRALAVWTDRRTSANVEKVGGGKARAVGNGGLRVVFYPC